jgi:hypothetical protein
MSILRYALKVMKLLKHTGKKAKAGVLFIPVYSLRLLYAFFPGGSWVISFGRMNCARHVAMSFTTLRA